MNEQIPPVDWTAVRPQATGERHYKGPGLGSGPWKCPACGQDNSRDLSLGCEHCGSGQNAAKHVGVDPPAKIPSTSTPSTSTYSTSTSEAAEIAFTRWLTTERPVLDTGGHLACRKAFLAGIAWAEKNLLQHLPTIEPKPDLPLKGSRESRTIVAALRLFVENILVENPEEVRNGEWLSAEEVNRMIEEMEQ